MRRPDISCGVRSVVFTVQTDVSLPLCLVFLHRVHRFPSVLMYSWVLELSSMVRCYIWAGFSLLVVRVLSFLSYCSMVAPSCSRDGLRRPGRPRGSRALLVGRRGGSGRGAGSTDSPDSAAFAHRRPSCRSGRRARGSSSSCASSMPSSVSRPACCCITYFHRSSSVLLHGGDLVGLSLSL